QRKEAGSPFVSRPEMLYFAAGQIFPSVKHMKLQKGDAAPDFTSKDQHGNAVKLSDLRGRKVVLYFYPKDDTSGCTAQACSLNDNLPALQ
ncbi:redoxin domain-containing protein, partial [Acinetobacter baumannii]